MDNPVSKITDFDVMKAAFETSGEELLKRSVQTTRDGYTLSYCDTGIDPFEGRYFRYGASVIYQDEGKNHYRLFIYRYVYKDYFRQGVRGYVDIAFNKIRKGEFAVRKSEILCYVFDGECPIADAKKELICRGTRRLKQLELI